MLQPIIPGFVNHPYFDDGEGSNDPARTLTLTSVPLDVIPPIQGYTGDINQDGSINILDAVRLVNVIIGGSTHFIDPEYNQSNFPTYMDVNSDSYLNILDVVMLTNFLLYGTWDYTGEE